jgi:hypothetical protein
MVNVMDNCDIDVLDIFEAAEIWSIKVVLPFKVGYTLWGINEVKKDDVFLCKGNKIILFGSLHALFNFIKNENQISAFYGYKQLKHFIIENNIINEDIDIDSFDFISVQNIICGNDKFCNLTQCAEVLDCLNLLYDVGMTLNEKTIISTMKRGQSELADLMDTLTFLKQEELSVLDKFDFHVICDLYTKFLKFFDERTVVL